MSKDVNNLLVSSSRASLLEQLFIVAIILISVMSVHAAAISYNFDDGTLQGWTNGVVATEGIVAHDTTVNTNGGRTVAHSADYMVLESDFGDRDSDTDVKILTSPEFMLAEGASVEIWTLGGTGGTATPTWSNIADLPTAATAGDFMGAALRRVSDGEYLLFSNRSGNGQSGRTINWLAVGWTAGEIANAVAGDNIDETYAVDLIDAYSGGWGWLGVDDVTLTEAFDVNANLILIGQPENEIAPVGNRVVFDVDVYSSANVHYQWHKEGDTEILSDSNVLAFRATEKHAGFYYCVVSDGLSETVISQTAELIVRDCFEILEGDINGDCKIDLTDLHLLLNGWLLNTRIELDYTLLEVIYEDFIDSLSEKVQVAAHRGNGFGDPENSLSTINSCIQAGVEVIEIDVRKTIDGHLVLMHDSTINRTTNGSGSVTALTLEQIRSYRLKMPNGTLSDEQVPTLNEAMMLVKNHCMVNLDKAWGIREDCLEVLQQTDTVNNAIFKSGGDAASLRTQIEALGTDINFMWMVSCSGTTSPTVDSILSSIDILKPQSVEIIFGDDQHPIMLRENTDEIRQRGTKVWVNTLWSGTLSGGYPDSNTATWEWMIDRGVTMMQTDSPQMLLDYLEANN